MSYELRDELIADITNDDSDQDFGTGDIDSSIGLTHEERVALGAPGLGDEGTYASNAGGDVIMGEADFENIVRQRYTTCQFPSAYH